MRSLPASITNSLCVIPQHMEALLCILANLLFSLTVEAQIRVGFIGGFTGPGQVFGKAAQNGFELARAELGSRTINVFREHLLVSHALPIFRTSYYFKRI